MDLVTPFMNNERPSSRSGGIVEGAVGEDVQRIGHEEVCSTEMEIAKGTGHRGGILSFQHHKSREGGASHPLLTYAETARFTG